MSVDPQQPSAVADPVLPPPMPAASPPRALEYAPPLARSRTTTLIGGLIVSIAYAFGCAMIAMGLMAGLRNDRDAPTFVAIGVFSIVFATGSLVTLWLARR